MAAAAGVADLPGNAVTMEQVARGRLLVADHDCAHCHTASSLGPDVVHNDPNDPMWLAGAPSGFSFGEGPSHKYRTYPANLTPDSETGLGRFTDRQIFNALRYGLDPADTPDVVITSTVPGQGNFPAEPHYLAPPMPWPAWRHMPEDELWDIVAYLKHGIRAVRNQVKDSQGPNDFWASFYTPDRTGPYPLPVFPAASEELNP